MRVTPALTEVITPRSEAEVRLMAEATTEAMREVGAASSMAMYDRAAAIYLERIVVYFGHPTRAPPDDLRYAKTTGERIKEASLRCTQVAREAAREREQRGVGAAADAAAASSSTALAVAEAIEAAADVAGSGWDGGALSAAVDEAAAAVVARGESKKRSRTKRNGEYQARSKQAVSVSLADLEDGKGGGDPVLRRIAQRLNATLQLEGDARIRVKRATGYGSAALRAAIVSVMRQHNLSELQLPAEREAEGGAADDD